MAGLLLTVSACSDTGSQPWRMPGESSLGPPRIELAPDERHQRLEGFGASVAWYIDTLVNHPQRAEIYATIFGELGLDILRFRNRYQRQNEEVDLAFEANIVEGATESLGRRPKLLLTSWSPPAALKANGDDDCRGEQDCTLVSTDGEFDYDGFAEYWAASLEEYAEHGVVPDFISIQNEPDFTPSGWEGCVFAPSENGVLPGYDRALATVHARLQSLASPPGLLGPETLGVHYDKPAMYLSVLDHSLLAGVAHHLYESEDWRGPDSYLTPMGSVPGAAGELPIFQTEFSTDQDNGIEGGFETAWLIHNSLASEGVSGWLYWDLVWGGDGGLVSLSQEGYALRDQYYSLRHYALHTDPGDVRVGAESNRNALRAAAFAAPDGERVTLVALNVGSSDEHVALELASYTLREGYLTTYRPGASERWQAIALDADSPALTLPSRSVATLVLQRPAGE